MGGKVGVWDQVLGFLWSLLHGAFVLFRRQVLFALIVLYAILMSRVFALLDTSLFGHTHPTSFETFIAGLRLEQGHGLVAWLTFAGIPILLYLVFTTIGRFVGKADGAKR